MRLDRLIIAEDIFVYDYKFNPLEFGYSYRGRSLYKYENVKSFIIYDSVVDTWRISLRGSTHCLYNGRILSDIFARELLFSLDLFDGVESENKNTYPYSSYHEAEDRCPTCSFSVNIDIDMDEMGTCKNCRV